MNDIAALNDYEIPVLNNYEIAALNDDDYVNYMNRVIARIGQTEYAKKAMSGFKKAYSREGIDNVIAEDDSKEKA